jgi:hypothetical protein
MSKPIKSDVVVVDPQGRVHYGKQGSQPFKWGKQNDVMRILFKKMVSKSIKNKK